MAIETAQELYNHVEAVTPTPPHFKRVLNLFNECVKHVATKYRLPGLETSSSLTTDTSYSYKALPTNYHRALFRCYSTTNKRQIPIYDSVASLLRLFSEPDIAGPVYAVAVRGSNLHYQRLPASAETLTLHYYKLPTDMSKGDDQPDGIPESLAHPLLVNYALAELFAGNSNELSGRYGQKFNQAMSDLALFVGPEDDGHQDIEQEIDWDWYLS